MSFVAVGIMAGASIAGGIVKHSAAKKEEERAKKQAKKAKEELNKQMEAYKNLDTSNPYLNMENVMEDLTINQKQAEFQAQQFQQSQANIMAGLRGAAGSSGIAGLAQALAGQGQLASQRSAASIGMQEASNQRAERAMAGQIQNMERQGEVYSRKLQTDKTSTLLGMAQQRSAAAQRRVGDARAAKTSAITGAISGIGSAAMAGLDAGAFAGGGGGAAKGLSQATQSGGPVSQGLQNSLRLNSQIPQFDFTSGLTPISSAFVGGTGGGGGPTGTASVDWGSASGFMLNGQPFGSNY